MKLRFTPRATENLAAIADHIRADSPAAAQRVRAAIYENLQDLIMFPLLGRQQEVDGVRKVVTRKYRYLVYYTVDADLKEIVILGAKHPAQQRDYSDV